MRPWVRQATRYAGLYAGGLVAAAVLLGFVPGIPFRGPVFVLSIFGAVIAFLAMWGAEEPSVKDLPTDHTESLPVPWRMLLFGGGILVMTWTIMLLPY